MTKHIEAYIASSLEHEEGAYKMVNSQTILYGSGEEIDNVRVEAKIIEDYYSKDGEYIKTKTINSTSGEREVRQTLQEPSTIMMPNDFKLNENTVFPLSQDLDEGEREELKQHILTFFED